MERNLAIDAAVLLAGLLAGTVVGAVNERDRAWSAGHAAGKKHAAAMTAHARAQCTEARTELIRLNFETLDQKARISELEAVLRLYEPSRAELDPAR